MKLGDLLRLSLSRLGTGKLRTALTMLGVVIGVASVVALVGVGQGATRGVTDRLQSLGTNLLSVNPGFSRDGVTRSAGGATTLTLADANALRSIPGVAGVAPQLSSSRLVVVGSKNESTTVVGTTPDYALVNAYSVWVGSFLTQSGLDHRLRVAVLGATTADNLGLGQSSIGTTISIGGLPFQLIGILQPKGGTGFLSPDEIVLIPVTTARELFVGTDSVRSVGVSVASEEQIETVKAEVTTTLEQRHGIDPAAGQSDDFTILDQSQLLGTVSSVSGVLTILLAGIASISLLVGGIGIMNIMLVSVRERTREIGIRKAVGARSRDILSQFLVEALALSLVGGAIGIVLGLGASALIGALAGWGFGFDATTVAVAVGFSLLVGILFGVWPASQASRLDPVVALRYE